jgi:FixJ family two-component response regulator
MSERRRWTPSRGHTGGVLVVEDDELVGNALVHMLRHAGFEASLASSVDGALATFDTTPIDVVVTDLQMPGGSGLDLLKALEGRDPLVPVIIVTGDMSLQPATAAVREHAFDYLTKPVSRDVLLSTVSRAIDSRRATQARVNAEQRLQEEHRQLAIRHQRTAMLLSVLYNRAVEGIIVLDAQGRLVDASDSFVALVGRPLYELLDADIGELFDLHPTEGDIQSRVVELAAAPLSRGHWRGEMTVRAARGRRLPARVSLSVCEVPSVDAASEQTRYVMALLYYETAHEEMSRQLQQADRLATMGLLAGSAAHEIRNELGPLLGYLTMLEQGNFEVAAADMIKVMRDSVRRVQEHIEQILAPLRPRGAAAAHASRTRRAGGGRHRARGQDRGAPDRPQPADQRDRRAGRRRRWRPRHRAREAVLRRRVRGPAGRRLRRGHPGSPARPRVRAVLHHQGQRRHRPGPAGGARHRAQPQRSRRARLARRGRHDRHRRGATVSARRRHARDPSHHLTRGSWRANGP